MLPSIPGSNDEHWVRNSPNRPLKLVRNATVLTNASILREKDRRILDRLYVRRWKYLRFLLVYSSVALNSFSGASASTFGRSGRGMNACVHPPAPRRQFKEKREGAKARFSTSRLCAFPQKIQGLPAGEKTRSMRLRQAG